MITLAEQNLSGGDIPYDESDFNNIRNILKEKSGISLSASKKPLVYSRLSRRVRLCSLPDFRSYVSFVNSPAGSEEQLCMIDALTTNVTNFFREKHHFEHFSQIVMPEIIRRAERGEKVRIWSSACSSGQEPFSIAMTILDSFPKANNYNIKILATDISFEMIDFCRRGVYSLKETESIPDNFLKKWSRKTGNEIHFSDDLKELVSFKNLNLLKPWPMQCQFISIFCRNVAIYFDRDTQNMLWRRLSDALLPGGYLYIGHSEKIAPEIVPDITPCGCPTTYRKDI
ncbi:CheR family methyltransferase [Acetobacter aceti]|uniref:Chemotaxis protein methyltransferase n=1 Tax=Acetobacter aceti TaxID=435 RepID=A0A6S6PGT1_ACEAC|nr:protein-glutamate O-methyltransferase [Acetobacter aceti]BCI66469.1 chemotaxis protein methyltransferase [Acetobacter aceti]